ncbi:MAG TPA: amidohydrolase [Acetivibrio sp.]|jgi:imidazolonepropionase-like amidohydrolase|nr:amidohydrolase [Clostridium sp.]HOQ37408.1 amidohydrolase [Acetivibrio sp.]HPT91071.1 amidohydrolase [Acetivibrio sp.]
MLLVKNGRIITMTGTDYENGYILIDEGKIVEVGDYPTALKPDILDLDNLSVIDAKDKYVLPGLIDAHCHVGMWEDSVGFEGDDGNEMTDPVTPHLRAIDAVYHMDRAFVEAYENGITTVVTGPGSANVIGGQFAALKTYGRRIEDMLVKSPVAIKVAFGENPKTVYSERKMTPTTRMATAAILRESLLQAIDYKEKLDEYNENKEENDKPDYDIKMEALLGVLNKEIPIKAHAHRADDILTAIRIAKEFDLKLTIEHCTEGHLIADILRDEGVSAIVGPYLTDRSKIELRNLSIKTPGILAKAGVKVAIMTDHPCMPIQYLSLAAAMAVREGMDEAEAMKAITINAAELTGIDDRVGSIEPGKDADIVIFDGHPFELKTRVVNTIINGKVVYERNKNERD